MKRLFLLLSAFAGLSVNAQDVIPYTSSLPCKVKTYRAPSEVMGLIHHKNNFYVQEQDKTVKIKRFNLDTASKKVNKDVLKHLNKNKEAYFNIKKLSNDDYKLYLQTRGNGGGIWTGFCAYYGTKAVAYTGYAVACVYDPELILHAGEISVAIETTAQAAAYVGTIAPTP